jgi:hypothetical protein
MKTGLALALLAAIVIPLAGKPDIVRISSIQPHCYPYPAKELLRLENRSFFEDWLTPRFRTIQVCPKDYKLT